ncbi:heparinase II/III family protein [Maribellus luteus]|uniref:heparinase II/III family protein n=1 Tax=Maribellus luteus TaxID=2305463 RepID=UPI00139064F2|nr:heparinase II/III family protein [Maribellus luteus]
MKSISFYIKKIRGSSFPELLILLYSKIRRNVSPVFRFRDLYFNTQSNSYLQLNSIINVGGFKELNDTRLQYFENMCLSHRFNLLGSGWVTNSYDSRSLGVEGHRYEMNVPIKEFDNEGLWLEVIVRKSHLKNAQKIWKLIDDNDYIPIDWQKDFKSGFRWSSKDWYNDVRKGIVGEKPGVDIKVPWELSRMQHFPYLALHSTGKNRNAIVKEFRNQVLDFIATNPPRMGVNWKCTMDVAIRAANLLISYDLFCQKDDGNVFDKEIQTVFANSMYEHGRHIFHNLEWQVDMTSNHYLANITGLLFIAAYLENTKETNTWLVFCTNEIIKQYQKQFYEDGANFEASTCYHRLSSEMIVYATALLLGLPDEKVAVLKHFKKNSRKVPFLYRDKIQYYKIEDNKLYFPDWYLQKLSNTRHFTKNISKPSGDVVQIGDNDSGQFFKLFPVGNFMSNKEAGDIYLNLEGYNSLMSENDLFWDENALNHSGLLNAFSGLYDSVVHSVEAGFVKKLSRNYMLKYNPEYYRLKIDTNFVIPELPFEDQLITKVGEYTDRPILEGAKLYTYSYFGLIIIKSPELFFSVFYGHHQNYYCNWGHAHSDKLSVELSINNTDIYSDPGTYIYTALPEKRMLFAKASAHHTIDTGVESLKRESTFLARADYQVKVIHCDVSKIVLYIEYGDVKHLRDISISNEAIIVNDKCNKHFTYPQFGFMSNGYGKIKKIDLR